MNLLQRSMLAERLFEAVAKRQPHNGQDDQKAIRKIEEVLAEELIERSKRA